MAGPGPTIIAVIGAVAGALYYLYPLPDLYASIRASVRQPAAPLASAAIALAGITVVIFGLLPYLAYALASFSQRV